MDAQLAALEEEVAILKGEIKSVLQEMRTAILASENPFASGFVARGVAAPPETPPQVIQLPSPPGSNPTAMAERPVAAVSADAGPDAGGGPPEAREAYTPAQPPQTASSPAATPAPSRWDEAGGSTRAFTPDVRALSALLTWVEETRERLDDRRYRVVLGLARYGDLIDDELEKTLLEAADTVGGAEPGARASTNDSVVALRQLEAILAPDSNVRRIADFDPDLRDRDRPFASREARPSRRQ